MVAGHVDEVASRRRVDAFTEHAIGCGRDANFFSGLPDGCLWRGLSLFDLAGRELPGQAALGRLTSCLETLAVKCHYGMAAALWEIRICGEDRATGEAGPGMP